ncbi:MAG: hypothetical protein VX615_00260 [Planctomycetota bacterium]|nr:hypothetical protein [Planctomycetota bacterium]
MCRVDDAINMVNTSWKNSKQLRIGEILIEQGLLTPREVDEILLEQEANKKPFGVIAEWLCGVSVEAIEEAWATQYTQNAPTIDPSVYKPRKDAVLMMSARQAWQFRCIPMNLEGNTLVLATTKSQIHRALKFATRVLCCPAYFVLTSDTKLAEGLNEYYPLSSLGDAKTTDQTIKALMQKLRFDRFKKVG